MRRLKAEIISVGNELLQGYVVNTNTAYLAANLAKLGFEVQHQSVVGDVSRDIYEALSAAVARSNIIVFTGGLGPTKDDLTKETVAQSLGMRLVRDEPTAQAIAGYFTSRGLPLPQNNLKQAMVIEGGVILKNNFGTAPGLLVQKGRQIIILLPGPPVELEPMFENEVKPLLAGFGDEKIATAELRVFGIGESALEEQIKELLYGENPSAALYASTGEVSIHVTAKGKTQTVANDLCEQLVGKLESKLGEYVYSTDGSALNKVVVELLRKNNARIALAESCTGGLMASEITAVDGASDVFEYGMAAYADWVKQSELDVERSIINKYTAVSSVAAAEMARGAYDAGKADIGVAITGVAGPGAGNYGNKPVGLVYIAVCDKARVVVKEFNFGNRSRAQIRQMSVKNALDMVRRFVLGYEIENAREFGPRDLADLDREGKPKTKGSAARRRAITTTLAIVGIAAAAFFGVRAVGDRLNAGVYDQVKSSYAVLASQNRGAEGLAELKAQNADTRGWLEIKNADLGCVVVQSEDNEFYKAHDFQKNKNKYGCCFIDSGVGELADARNIVIYGSSDDKKQLFGPLVNYTNLQFMRSNPVFGFRTEDGEAQYKIVSVYYANTNGAMGDVQQPGEPLVFESGAEFVDYVVDLKLRSIYTTPVDIKGTDNFITLITPIADWDGAALVVVGRAVREGEDAGVLGIDIGNNVAALYPEAYHEVNGTSSTVNVVTTRDKWQNWLVESDPTLSGDSDSGAEWPPVSDGEDPTAGNNIDYNEKQDTPNESNSQTGVTLSIRSSSDGKIYTDTPLEIISMIVEAEVGSSFHSEAIKAQAVASITYLKYSYRTSSTPSMPTKKASSTVRECVREVIDKAMYYNGSIIYAPYCASMAGRSNACNEVWVENLPYLVSTESSYDYLSPGYTRSYTYSKAEMKSTLEKYYEITLSNNPANWIQIKGYTSGGYVGELSIDGQYTTTGSNFRSRCMYIRSAAFTVHYDAASGTFTIVTSAYGHGVGMSQYGAHYYASKEGWTYEQILKHYYSGVSIGAVSW